MARIYAQFLVLMLVSYHGAVYSNSIFDGIEDDRPVSLEGVITFTDGNSVEFAQLSNDGKPTTCRFSGKLNGPMVGVQCKDVSQIVFNDKDADYSSQNTGSITVINNDKKSFNVENAYFFGTHTSGKINYVTINPITGKVSYAYESIRNNIRFIAITSSTSIFKCNPKTGKYYPVSYNFDPMTSVKLTKCKPSP